MQRKASIIIVGGGVIGSATAMYAKELMPHAKVTVVERDPSYRQASSALSASSIRQQFSSPVNIELSLFALKFLRRAEVRKAVNFVEGGYLFLASSAEGMENLASNVALQQRMKCDITLFSNNEKLKARFPWLTCSDLCGGAFGETGEGWFDGYSMLHLLKQSALANDAEFVQGEVTEINQSTDNTVSGVAYKGHDGQRRVLEADWVVNAGGPWGRSVAAMVGLELPVYARRRVINVIESTVPVSGVPLVVDTSGLWFRRDTTLPDSKKFLVGWAPTEEHDPSDMPLDIGQADEQRFQELLWPSLAARVEAFESVKVQSSWAGYYEVHPMDHNAIVGPHPTRLRNFLFANGFSGHGLMQSVGVGRCLAEWMRDGRYTTVDLAPLGYERVLSKVPYAEKNVI